MNIDFKLEFFYYREKIIFGGEDQYFLSLLPDIDKAQTYVKACQLSEFLRLYTRALSNNYVIPIQMWRMISTYSKNVDLPYPEYVNPDSDFYIHQHNLTRSDLYSIYYKLHRRDDNFCFLELIEMRFLANQNTNELAEEIEKELQEKQFSKIVGTSIIYQVSDSPIKTIEISESIFKLTINSDYWDEKLGIL
jgi:hypothetical protein